jgi:hypothetical protein
MRQPQEHDLTLSGVAGEVRDFYNRYPYPPPVDNLEKYRWLWQDPHGAARIITCFGQPDLIRKTALSSLPAAAHRGQQSMHCVGQKRGL